ncbi:MAG: FtsQ-type POTRA domain-containing protein [Clostridia bacterium]|nr:FtsQ-type POTRA domain-containing protein [Clostridia bacterium]
MNNVVQIDSYRKRKTSPKNPKILTTVMYLLILAVAFYFFLHSSFFNIKKISVTGNKLLEKEKILNLSQVKTGQNLISIDKGEIKKRILVHPLVKDVEIKRNLPTTLEIEIKEREPIGLVVCPDGFIQVCDEGYFLALIDDLGSYNLPVISGLSLEQLPGPGQKIENQGLFNALAILKEGKQGFLENIVELNISNENHILAYTVQGIEIRLGTLENMSTKLENLNKILEDVINKEIMGNSVEYIDLRFSGPPVIKKK